jgi:hypothetical protein
MEETNSTAVVPVGPAGSSPGQQPAAGTSADDLQLVSRFVVGLLLFGGEELLIRLRAAGRRLEAAGELAVSGAIPADETMTQMAGYLAVGLLVRGRRRLARTVKRGLRFYMNATGRVLGAAGRVTDNRLARPFRQPVERRMLGLLVEGQSAIDDGRREVVASRKLSDATLGDIMEEVIQLVADNPELAAAVQRIMVGQGTSLTGTVVDNAQQLSTSGDDLAEGIVRRLLRRKPRPDLPPSPLAGKPLTMYAPSNPEQGAQDDVS